MLVMRGRSDARDEIDVGRLARDHYDAVFRFCARRIGADRAADAAQETFLTAHGAAKRFRGESSPLTWLFGIAHNHCRRSARRERMNPTIALGDMEIPVEGTDATIDREALARALHALSTEHRDVVILHEIEGRTYEEIALILGCPAGTVKSRLHYAFRALRADLFPAS